MATYAKSDSVIDRIEEDGTYFLFDARHGKFRRLNPVAGYIFEMCDGKTDEEQMAAKIAERFARVDPTMVGRHVSEFLVQLKEASLITVQGHQAI